MHLPSHLPQPKAVAVESVFPHGKLQEVLWVQNWAAARGSWKTAMRRDQTRPCTHILHIQLQQHGGHCTIVPFRYTSGNTHTPTHAHTHTQPPFHTHTQHKLTNARISVSTVYQDNSRCLMCTLAKFANFHLGKSSPLNGTRLFLNKIGNF